MSETAKPDPRPATTTRSPRPQTFSYDATKTLHKVWAFSGGQYGKYLAAVMEDLLDSLERHGELVFSTARYPPAGHPRPGATRAATVAPTPACQPSWVHTPTIESRSKYLKAGGSYVYGRETFGAWPGFFAGWCFVAGKTASLAAMALVAGHYLTPNTPRITGLAILTV